MALWQLKEQGMEKIAPLEDLTTIGYGIKMTTDPTGYYREMFSLEEALHKCIHGCGILPNFMLGNADNIAENMEKNYMFHSGWTMAEGDKARIVDEMFTYPGDPPLYPYLKTQLVNEEGEGYGDVIYIYPYAQVCVVNDGKLVKRTRMD
jgi:hypothetical protein